MVLVDKNFNTLVDPRDEKVVAKFGKNSDSRRLYAVSEVCVQAISAGDCRLLSLPKTQLFMVMNKYLSEKVSLEIMLK